jgi:hypothetical protein
MSPRATALLFAVSLIARRNAAGQHPRPAPSLLLRVYGGAAVSQPVRWSLDRQPLYVPSRGTYDTVSLRRHINPGIVYGLGVLYFPTTLLGVLGRIEYLGLATGSRCSGVYYDPAATSDDNQTVCANIQGQTGPLGMVRLDLEPLVRVFPRRAFSPYLRGGVTLATYEASTIYVEGQGSLSAPTHVVIDDPSPASITTGYAAGAGLSAARKRVSQVVFTFGFDFVLDGRRGRRY